jgi:hypothetical protein
VIQKTAARSLAAWKNGSGARLRLPQSRSTITLQLGRVYFLPWPVAEHRLGAMDGDRTID